MRFLRVPSFIILVKVFVVNWLAYHLSVILVNSVISSFPEIMLPSKTPPWRWFLRRKMSEGCSPFITKSMEGIASGTESECWILFFINIPLVLWRVPLHRSL